jgi:hypothetical protein
MPWSWGDRESDRLQGRVDASRRIAARSILPHPRGSCVAPQHEAASARRGRSRILISCQSPVSAAAILNKQSSNVSHAWAARRRNPRASSRVDVARATQEVVPCSSGTVRGSRHVSLFPPQWRQPWWRNRRSREEERRPDAVAPQLPRRTRRPRRARLQLRTPRPPPVRLRRHRHHAPRRRSQHRGMRRRKPPRRARLTKRPALRRSSLPVRPAAREPRPLHGMRRRRRPRRLPRSSSSRRSPDGAAAVERGLRNRPRTKT